MSTIYTKSPAGQREITSRSNAVSPRARMLLILIDGKRTDTELAALVPDFAASADALLKAGFIVATDSIPPPVASVRPAGAAAPAARAAQPSAAAAPTARSPSSAAQKDFATLRRDAARAVNDLLGPEGDAFAMRVERAAELEVLQVALERCISYIATTRGKRVAEDFAQRYLPSTGS